VSIWKDSIRKRSDSLVTSALTSFHGKKKIKFEANLAAPSYYGNLVRKPEQRDLPKLRYYIPAPDNRHMQQSCDVNQPLVIFLKDPAKEDYC
jgi:hypothetical protein